MTETDPKIDLKRFKKHERKIPWALIRKIIIALVLLGLIIYLNHTMKSKTNDHNQIELQLE